MDDIGSLWELAKISTGRVSFIAVRLSAERTRPTKRERVLGQLGTSLFLVHRALELPSPDQQKHLWTRLEELLAELEKLCMWRKDNGLQAQNLSKDFERYPCLHTIASATPPADVEKRVRPSLTAFASASTRLVERYLSNIDSFAASKNDREASPVPTEQSVPQSKKPLDPPDEYPVHVNQSLYAALHRHSTCTCSGSASPECKPKRHLGRLRLRGKHKARDNHILFDAVFSAAPSPTAMGDEVRWQQLRLQVASTKPGSKSVKVSTEDATRPPTKLSSDEQRPRPVQVGEFCELLAKRLGDVCICLNLLAGELHPLRDGEQIDHHIIPKPSMSLSSALRVRRLSTKMKIVLACILSRSVWQFYHSDWMKTKWTSELIHFMLERCPDDEVDTEQPKLYACNPCFAFQFDDSDHNFMEYCGADHIGHRYPRVLALGILLVEIGGDIPGAQPTSQAQSLEEMINNDWMRGKVALKKERWPDFDFQSSGTMVRTYKEVVANCFEQKIFNADMPPSHTGDERGIEERRAILYERVVYPLEKLLMDMGWTAAMEDIEPMGSMTSICQPFKIRNAEYLQPEPLKPIVDLTHREITIKNTPQNSKFCLFDNVSYPGVTDHADKWFKLLREDVLPLLPKNPKLENRVKIAILDTGIDMTDHFISENRHRIKAKSFLPNDNSVEDIHGHGTHAAALLLRVAKNADIYIARITKTNDLLDPKPIEEAILEATEKWKVDIITMSFGFTAFNEDLKDIHSAIGKAFKADILMFCAASNGGGNVNIAYPANQDQVICVNSANGEGNPSGYNPDEPKPGRNLSALGEGVKSSWPTRFKLGQQRQSGTSVATPIAAALAAVVLDYVRHEMPESDRFHVSKLRMRKGMLEVLELMSKRRGGYQYLNPMQLFDGSRSSIYGSIRDVLVKV
ncbi:uncharacterized protein PAC_01091 [Phialocephala subalpina]|uniref:Uncharacterized protein n=1 Tax=Phialocephala subalpina TaxID=576137 RepID=A0A1L7WEM1_9HELO|nr:uncharacterized protein PAC_01091 [Phialocephala subalpina]